MVLAGKITVAVMRSVLATTQTGPRRTTGNSCAAADPASQRGHHRNCRPRPTGSPSRSAVSRNHHHASVLAASASMTHRSVTPARVSAQDSSHSAAARAGRRAFDRRIDRRHRGGHRRRRTCRRRHRGTQAVLRRSPHRRTGAASAIITAQFSYAATAGARVVRLETGVEQHAAIRFYARHGFVHIEPFGPYLASASSVCMARSLSG